jgi:hypothetical protein
VTTTGWPALACASTLVALEIDGDSLGEVVAEVAHVLLSQRLSCDDYHAMSVCEHLGRDRGAVHTFKRLFDVDCLLSARLEVGDAALGLAEGHGAL